MHAREQFSCEDASLGLGAASGHFVKLDLVPPT